MKISTAAIIAGIGVILSLCVGLIGGAAAGFYVSQAGAKTISQVLPLPGSSTLPNQTQPNQSLPNDDQPNQTQPNQTFPGFRNPGRIFPQSGVQGAVVMQVTANSPAEKAGLQMGDIITAVNGQAVDTDHPLNEVISQAKPGDTVELTVQRGTQKQTLKVTLGTNPDNSSAPYLGIRFTMFETPTRTPGQTG